MTWVAVAIGGSALIGAGASYAGSKKQSDAAKSAANLNQDQFRINNAQQQPFIQSGYGAMSRLNTLLGINANPRAARPGGMPALMGQPQPGMPPSIGSGPRMYAGGPGGDPLAGGGGNTRIARLLMLRAQNGDTQAANMLQQITGGAAGRMP